MTALPTAASGYATPTSDQADPTETLTHSAQLQNLDWAGTGNISQVNTTYTVSATGNTVNGNPEFMVTYNGTPVVVQWSIANSRYEGINGDIELRLAPWYQTANGQASLGWVNLNDNGGAVGDSWGFVVNGFNSDPAAVAGRSGSATFIGTGGVSLNAQDNSFWTSADGTATLTANFNTNMISGIIDLTDCGCGFGGVTIASNSMTLNPMAITANTFNGTASINSNDFGLSSVGTISASGMFYEAGATAVGGDVSGIGTATLGNGGGTAFLNGAFVAEQ